MSQLYNKKQYTPSNYDKEEPADNFSFFKFQLTKEPAKHTFRTRKIELETQDKKAPIFHDSSNFEFFETYYDTQTPDIDYYWNLNDTIYA